uniref:Vacuolar iron transporter n=1 Tax=Cajanus cajan TaxID=3821 RepID=A0A151T7U2_CAJCA|nr:Nodulin-21 [Cajanus cajan]
MMGVGAVSKDVKTMMLTGVAGLVAGACSMAIGEFVSVYSQYDIELRVPLLGAAFVKSYKLRLGVLLAVVTLALLLFGDLAAILGKAPRVKSTLRVLIGGWMAMAITFGLTKLVDHVGV